MIKHAAVELEKYEPLPTDLHIKGLADNAQLWYDSTQKWVIGTRQAGIVMYVGILRDLDMYGDVYIWMCPTQAFKDHPISSARAVKHYLARWQERNRGTLWCYVAKENARFTQLFDFKQIGYSFTVGQDVHEVYKRELN